MILPLQNAKSHAQTIKILDIGRHKSESVRLKITVRRFARTSVRVFKYTSTLQAVSTHEKHSHQTDDSMRSATRDNGNGHDGMQCGYGQKVSE